MKNQSKPINELVKTEKQYEVSFNYYGDKISELPVKIGQLIDVTDLVGERVVKVSVGGDEIVEFLKKLHLDENVGDDITIVDTDDGATAQGWSAVRKLAGAGVLESGENGKKDDDVDFQEVARLLKRAALLIEGQSKDAFKYKDIEFGKEYLYVGPHANVKLNDKPARLMWGQDRADIMVVGAGVTWAGSLDLIIRAVQGDADAQAKAKDLFLENVAVEGDRDAFATGADPLSLRFWVNECAGAVAAIAKLGGIDESVSVHMFKRIAQSILAESGKAKTYAEFKAGGSSLAERALKRLKKSIGAPKKRCDEAVVGSSVAIDTDAVKGRVASFFDGVGDAIEQGVTRSDAVAVPAGSYKVVDADDTFALIAKVHGGVKDSAVQYVVSKKDIGVDGDVKESVIAVKEWRTGIYKAVCPCAVNEKRVLRSLPVKFFTVIQKSVNESGAGEYVYFKAESMPLAVLPLIKEALNTKEIYPVSKIVEAKSFHVKTVNEGEEVKTPGRDAIRAAGGLMDKEDDGYFTMHQPGWDSPKLHPVAAYRVAKKYFKDFATFKSEFEIQEMPKLEVSKNSLTQASFIIFGGQGGLSEFQDMIWEWIPESEVDKVVKEYNEDDMIWFMWNWFDDLKSGNIDSIVKFIDDNDKFPEMAEAASEYMVECGWTGDRGEAENESRVNEAKKIRVYADGKYLFTTTRYNSVKDAIASVEGKDSVDVAGRNLTGKENPALIKGKKLTGEIVCESAAPKGEYSKYFDKAVKEWERDTPNVTADDDDILNLAIRYWEDETGMTANDNVIKDMRKEFGLDESNTRQIRKRNAVNESVNFNTPKGAAYQIKKNLAEIDSRWVKVRGKFQDLVKAETIYFHSIHGDSIYSVVFVTDKALLDKEYTQSHVPGVIVFETKDLKTLDQYIAPVTDKVDGKNESTDSAGIATCPKCEHKADQNDFRAASDETRSAGGTKWVCPKCKAEFSEDEINEKFEFKTVAYRTEEDIKKAEALRAHGWVAINVGSDTIQFQRDVKSKGKACPECNGSGQDEANAKEECVACGGSGRYEDYKQISSKRKNESKVNEGYSTVDISMDEAIRILKSADYVPTSSSMEYVRFIKFPERAMLTLNRLMKHFTSFEKTDHEIPKIIAKDNKGEWIEFEVTKGIKESKLNSAKRSLNEGGGAGIIVTIKPRDVEFADVRIIVNKGTGDIVSASNIDLKTGKIAIKVNKFDAKGYEDGMMDVRGDLLACEGVLDVEEFKKFAKKIIEHFGKDDEIVNEEVEFQIEQLTQYDSDISDTVFAGWVRGKAEGFVINDEVFNDWSLVDERIYEVSSKTGVVVPAISISAKLNGEEGKRFYEDVFTHYYPSDEEVKEYIKDNDIDNDDIDEVRDQLIDMHNDDILGMYKISESKRQDGVNETIVKVGDKWQVQSHKGRNMGTYDTKEAAEKRLKQVEFFKNKNEKYHGENKKSIAEGVKFIDGIPIFQHNLTTEYDGFYVSYLAMSRDYGSPTTALVYRTPVDEHFLILNGDHREGYRNAIGDSKGKEQLEKAKAYFRSHKSEINKMSGTELEPIGHDEKSGLPIYGYDSNGKPIYNHRNIKNETTDSVDPSAKKIGVKEIYLYRAEGPALSDGTRKRTVKTYKEARSVLRDWSSTAPKAGEGYDKVDFKVTFEDGETYEGRLDIKHYTAPNNDLDVAQHIKDTVKYYSGERPAWRKEKDYEDSMRGIDKQKFKDFLAKYDLDESVATTKKRTDEDASKSEPKKFKSADGVEYWAERIPDVSAQPWIESWMVVSQVDGYPKVEAYDEWFASEESAQEMAERLSNGYVDESRSVSLCEQYEYLFDPKAFALEFWTEFVDKSDAIDSLMYRFNLPNDRAAKFVEDIEKKLGAVKRAEPSVEPYSKKQKFFEFLTAKVAESKELPADVMWKATTKSVHSIQPGEYTVVSKDDKEFGELKSLDPKKYIVRYGTEGAEGKAASTVVMRIRESVDKDAAKLVATEIINQLGGTNRLSSMIGANRFTAVASGNGGVSFMIGSGAKNKAKYIKIELNAKDEYDVTFYDVAGKELSAHKDVNVENLKELIRNETGMKLSLSESNVSEAKIKILVDGKPVAVTTAAKDGEEAKKKFLAAHKKVDPAKVKAVYESSMNKYRVKWMVSRDVNNWGSEKKAIADLPNAKVTGREGSLIHIVAEKEFSAKNDSDAVNMVVEGDIDEEIGMDDTWELRNSKGVVIGSDEISESKGVKDDKSDDETKKPEPKEDVEAVAQEAGIDLSKVDQGELKAGLKVEEEHALFKAAELADKIKFVIEHLKELPDYYTRLKAMEDAAKKKDVKESAEDPIAAKALDLLKRAGEEKDKDEQGKLLKDAAKAVEEYLKELRAKANIPVKVKPGVQAEYDKIQKGIDFSVKESEEPAEKVIAADITDQTVADRIASDKKGRAVKDEKTGKYSVLVAESKTGEKNNKKLAEDMVIVQYLRRKSALTEAQQAFVKRVESVVLTESEKKDVWDEYVSIVNARTVAQKGAKHA